MNVMPSATSPHAPNIERFFALEDAMLSSLLPHRNSRALMKATNLIMRVSLFLSPLVQSENLPQNSRNITQPHQY